MRLLLSFCLLLSSTLAGASTTNPTYALSQDISTPFQHLGHLAIADFNGDGKLDLAVTSSLDASLLIYLNQGNGIFAAPLTYQLASGQSLDALAAGDFNEDGKQDLVITTISGQQEAIFLAGNGDGTFTQGAILQNSGAFLDASVVDFNQDGHLDLVTANNGNLTVYLGDGRGSFSAQPYLGPAGAFFGLTVADFNKDSHLDVVTGQYTGGNNAYPELGVRFYAGDGDGSVQPATYSSASFILSPYQFASADFNGDGNLDVLFSQPNESVVIFGNGDGTFNLAPSNVTGFYVPEPDTSDSAPSPPLVAAADMNVDGKPDGVIADIIANTINVFFNDGTSNFYNQPSFSGSLDPGTSAMQVADLNGDGLPDIVLTNYMTQKISIFLSIRPKSAPVLTLSSPSTQALVGTPLAVTAKVAGATSTTVATGSVTLLDGTMTLGQQSLDASGQATFTLTTLAVGTHPLSFTYTGDQNYLTGTSAVLSQAITDFQVAVPTSTQTTSAGGTAAFSVNISPITGLAGTATATCSGLPATYSCPPVSTTLTGQPATLTLAVTVPSTAQAEVASAVGSVTLAVFAVPAFTFAFRRRRLSAMPSLLACTVLLAWSIGLSGCSSSNSTTTPPTPVTTAFTISVAVTQNGRTVTHNTPASLTVN